MENDWPIFIIALEGEDARRRPLTDALKSAGLDYRVFKGIDGRKGLPKQYAGLVDREIAIQRMGRKMSDSEFACALSHRGVYEIIMAEGLAGAIVFEDDAEVGPNFLTFLKEKHHRTESLILFDYRYGRSVPWQKKQAGQWTLHRAAQRATLASAYSVSKKSAFDLLAATTPVSYVADWPEDLWKLKAWLVSPRIAIQRSDQNNISLIGIRQKGSEDQVRRAVSFNLVTYIRRRLARRVGIN